MLALALTLCQASPLTELIVPKDTQLIDIQAIGPRGEMAVLLKRGETTWPYLLREGKLTEIDRLPASLFTNSELSPIHYRIKGFLPNGDFYGEASCTSFGARMVIETRPFMVRKGVIELIEIPEPFDTWESSSLLDMQPDGTATFAMSASMIGVVGESTEHAMIRVRDGKLVDRLKIDSTPLFGPAGRIYASQVTTPQGSPDVPFLGPTVTHLVVIEHGRVMRLAEGEPLLILHDGSLLFEREFPPTWISDEEIAWPDGRRTLHLLRAGKVTDFTFPGKPQKIDSIEIDAQGRGVVTGSDQGQRVVRAFNQSASFDLTNGFKSPEDIQLGPSRDGLFVIRARSRTGQPDQFFTYSVP